jgi:hypothetical protein
MQHIPLSTERQLVRLRIGEIKRSNPKTATDYTLKQATSPPYQTLCNSPFQDNPSFLNDTQKAMTKKKVVNRF